MLEFKESTVPTETEVRVREQLRSGRGCLVTGPFGSGKSHAVRQAVNGAVWVNLDVGSMQATRFFVDLARQVDGGEAILEAVAGQDFETAALRARRRLGDRCLVVDRAERLGRRLGSGWSGDPLRALTTRESAVVQQWLSQRGRSPTVIVGRRAHVDWGSEAMVHHRAPERSPLELIHGDERDWETLVDTVERRPGGQVLARAVLPLLGPEEFQELLDEARSIAHEDDLREVYRLLAETLVSRAPAAWGRVIELTGALDGAPRKLLERMLDPADLPALHSLLRVKLLEERDGRLTVLPVLRDFARPSSDFDRDALLRSSARVLVNSVNDPWTLSPLDADAIFRAHQLYVRLGSFEDARKTARMHKVGLIKLAKQKSIGHASAEARRLYDSILDLLEHEGTEPRTTHGRRIKSYVVHYRGYNDDHASEWSSPQAIEDYERSIELWAENALWRQHKIQSLIRRGDLRGAKDELHRAYDEIDDHPRRDTTLRLRPAFTALSSGAALFSVELVDDLEIEFNTDAEGAESLTRLHQLWSQGMELEELHHDGGRLLFRRPIDVKLRRRGEGWRADTKTVVFYSPTGRGVRPTLALEDLGRRLAEEARSLLARPSHLLSDEELARKGEIIAHVDPLNSDLGLAHADHRWLLGKISGGSFVPMQARDFDEIELPEALRPSGTAAGEYFAKVPVSRDGRPSGPVEELSPAGSGRPIAELRAELARLRRERVG